MMTRGLRDEENTRINNILQRLMSMPNQPDSAIDDQLKGLALNVSVLESMTDLEIIEHLKRLHFDAENMELFADFLVEKANSATDKTADYIKKTKAIYQQIQSQSNVFSVAIQNKLKALN